MKLNNYIIICVEEHIWKNVLFREFIIPLRDFSKVEIVGQDSCYGFLIYQDLPAHKYSSHTRSLSSLMRLFGEYDHCVIRGERRDKGISQFQLCNWKNLELLYCLFLDIDRIGTVYHEREQLSQMSNHYDLVDVRSEHIEFYCSLFTSVLEHNGYFLDEGIQKYNNFLENNGGVKYKEILVSTLINFIDRG